MSLARYITDELSDLDLGILDDGGRVVARRPIEHAAEEKPYDFGPFNEPVVLADAAILDGDEVLRYLPLDGARVLDPGQVLRYRLRVTVRVED